MYLPFEQVKKDHDQVYDDERSEKTEYHDGVFSRGEKKT